MLTCDPDFVPPFCPRPSCRYHRDPTGWRWHRDGTHSRQSFPLVVRRFRCVACGRRFCTQTFDTTYWLKRPDLQRPLLAGLVAGSAFRQLGRSLGVAGTTLERQASRLGRHCLLFEQRLRPASPPREPLVLDGLVSFEYSQYWPFEINVLVGQRSHYVLGFTASELRRSGRMTPAQKARRAQLEAELGTPDPKATLKAVRSLLRLALPAPCALQLHSDQHRAYPRAFRHLPHEIEHHTVSSRRCRTARNPLFAVDLLDVLVRHSSANHKRETLAFSKRRQGALERMAVLVAWRNHVKRVSERRGDAPTPAMTLGLAASPLTADDILVRRLFPTLVRLPPEHRRIYWRRVRTRQVPNGTRHAPVYAW